MFFSLFNIKSGEQLFIVLEHNEGCVPKFVNPEVLLPKSTFVCQKISATKNGLISWTTTNEKEIIDFAIDPTVRLNSLVHFWRVLTTNQIPDLISSDFCRRRQSVSTFR